MPVQRDISNNLTRIVRTAQGYAGEIQDVIGWLKVTPYCPTEDSANLSLLGLGYQEAVKVIVEV